MTKNTDFDAVIRQCGLKNTKSRSAILDILDRSDQPISAEQVFLELKKKKISANLSTVYRALDALASKDLAIKLNIAGDSRNLYEFNRMVHRHYLVCLGCNKIMAIDSCPLVSYEKFLAKETNYLITGHKLDIYGYCPECQEKFYPKSMPAL